MSKIAFIYPGQGVQKVGMGKDFYENGTLARELFDRASKELDFDVRKMCFEENDKLDMTEYTQAAIVTTCLAITREVEQRGLNPDITAGLSLGEYAAIAAAGGMQDMDAIRLVRKRGILMQNTVPAGEGAMCAILSLDTDIIEKEIAPIDGVEIANYNCPGQVVITGTTTGVAQAAEELARAGAKRTVMLNVSGPFHSKMLVPAGEELKQVLDKIQWSELDIPYVTNVTAQIVEDITQSPQLLERQVSASVRWMQSMETMMQYGVDTFVEIGPGRTLSGFLRKINKEARTYQISTWEDMEKVIGELGK